MKNAASPGAPAYLVVGGDGLIGKALVRALRVETKEVYATSRRPDSRDTNVVSLDLSGNPDDLFHDGRIHEIAADGRLTAFISAAITKIAECEQDPVRTRLVNVTYTVGLGEKLLEAGARVVFLSSNAVFSGAQPFPIETDVPAPNNNYGRQKAEAEQELLRIHAALPDAPPLMIARLTKVVDRTAPLIAGWIESLRAGLSINAFEDRRLSPISLGHAVSTLIAAGKAGATGIYHVTGTRDLSYYEFARLLAFSLAADPDLVVPVIADSSIVGLVQQHSALGNTAADKALAIRPEAPEAAARSLVS